VSYLDEIAAAVRQELSADVLPDEPHVERLLRAYAVLIRAKGKEVTIRDVHDAWAAWMLDLDPQHPAIQPFEQLDVKTQAQDLPFLTALQRVASDLGP
jgi:hypothetical protein